jgi:hypothetical protein
MGMADVDGLRAPNAIIKTAPSAATQMIAVTIRGNSCRRGRGMWRSGDGMIMHAPPSATKTSRRWFIAVAL